MAVALDFHLITRSIEARKLLADQENAANKMTLGHINDKQSAASTIQPNTSLVEKMANLLNINLGGDSNKSKQPEKDDLSAILGSLEETSSSDANKPKPKVISSPIDIRNKYASKLRNKIDGGVAGLELANSEKENTMSRGDASIHMTARNLLSQEGMMGQTTNTSSSRWLATTGVGKLLSFLSARSMQIVLLPLPSTTSHPQSDEDVKLTNEEMVSLTKQLPSVKFDLFIPDGRRRGEERTERANDNTANDVLQNVLSKLDHVPPIKFVVVSDRDDYLKAARDNEMFTCRIRPKNKRRGNITTNYNVDDVAGVQDVVDDINGISFNAALKR